MDNQVSVYGEPAVEKISVNEVWTVCHQMDWVLEYSISLWLLPAHSKEWKI